MLISVIFYSFSKTDNNKPNNTDKEQDKSLEQSIERGREIYDDFCINCHLPNGNGTEGIIPPLAQSDYLNKNRTESIRAIKYGQKGEIVVNGIKYNGFMAPMGLDDEEVADVMNYILSSWGNTLEKIVSKEEVAKVGK